MYLRSACSLLFAIVFSLSAVYAQIPSLGVATGGLAITPMGGTIQEGQLLTYFLTFENKGQQPFTGEIQLGRSILNLTDSFMYSDTVPLLDSLGLNPQDTASGLFVDTVLSARYGGGDGTVIVVVWPVTNAAMTIDSAQVEFIYQTNQSTGLFDGKNLGDFVCYPNPTTGSLFFNYGDLHRQVEHVILLNALGHELARYQGAIDEIPTGHLPKGTYFIRMENGRGEYATFRIVK